MSVVGTEPGERCGRVDQIHVSRGNTERLRYQRCESVGMWLRVPGTRQSQG